MNTQDLYDVLTRRMCAFKGPPQAYIEIEPAYDGQLLFRLVYKVYAIGIESAVDDTTDYEDLLCQEFIKRFDQTQTEEERGDQVGTLIWRREPRFNVELVSKWDQTADGGRGDYVLVEPHRMRHLLSIRIYCPRLDKVMQAQPEGVETSEWLESRT